MVIVIITFLLQHWAVVAQRDTSDQEPQLPSITVAHSTKSLYVGLENRILISESDYDASKISAAVTAGNGYLTAWVPGKIYNATVEKEGEITITVNIDTGTDSLHVKKTFRARNPPLPEPYFGNYKHYDTVSADSLKNYAKEMFARYPGPYVDGVDYIVIRYKFILAKKNGKSVEVNVLGSKLNEKALALMKKIAPGDRVIFDKVRCNGPLGDRNLAPLIITVK